MTAVVSAIIPTWVDDRVTPTRCRGHEDEGVEQLERNEGVTSAMPKV